MKSEQIVAKADALRPMTFTPGLVWVAVGFVIAMLTAGIQP